VPCRQNHRRYTRTAADVAGNIPHCVAAAVVRQSTKAIPREVLEAGAVDGANIYQIFSQIALPMVKNAILTVALIQFFFIWNDLLLSRTFINVSNLLSIQSEGLTFRGRFGQREWGPTFASISIAVVPVPFLYLLLNR
jgi:raffinose/stachyose/melibiose transport system permease protein